MATHYTVSLTFEHSFINDNICIENEENQEEILLNAVKNMTRYVKRADEKFISMQIVAQRRDNED